MKPQPDKKQSALDLHRAAINYADEALLARLRLDHKQAIELYRLALGREREAADLATAPLDRAVFYRSAAWMAIDCDEREEAIRLAKKGLACEPPVEIAHELREVLKKARGK